MLDERDVTRFMSKIQIGPGCWPFKAKSGNFRLNGKVVKAPRVAFLRFKGPIPPTKLVLHECDGGDYFCCRPDHIMAGTHAQNQADKMLKGRSTHGEKHPCHKLTVPEVQYIRKARAAAPPVQVKVLAAAHGVNASTIFRACSGDTWSRVAWA